MVGIKYLVVFDGSLGTRRTSHFKDQSLAERYHIDVSPHLAQLISGQNHAATDHLRKGLQALEQHRADHGCWSEISIHRLILSYHCTAPQTGV